MVDCEINQTAKVKIGATNKSLFRANLLAVRMTPMCKPKLAVKDYRAQIQQNRIQTRTLLRERAYIVRITVLDLNGIPFLPRNETSAKE